MRQPPKTMIVLIRKESILESWMRDASTLALIVATIGIGIYLESSAMQWLGAIIAFISILAGASHEVKARTYTLEGAQAELDKMKAEAEGK